jgi:hypothetical protein
MLADKHIGDRLSMTLNQLKEILTGLRTGDRACISYDIYGVLFPPGEPDVDARARCYEFAKLAACRTENDPRNQKVWFVKDA